MGCISIKWRLETNRFLIWNQKIIQELKIIARRIISSIQKNMTIQKFGRGLLIYTVAFASAFTTRYVVRSLRNSTTWSTSEIQSKTQFESNINNRNFSKNFII